MAEQKIDPASYRFNDVASKWDQKPSTIVCTNKMSEAIKQMDWYVSLKKDGKMPIRAMDFGCGTGLLSTKIAGTPLVSSAYPVIGGGGEVCF